LASCGVLDAVAILVNSLLLVLSAVFFRRLCFSAVQSFINSYFSCFNLTYTGPPYDNIRIILLRCRLEAIQTIKSLLLRPTQPPASTVIGSRTFSYAAPMIWKSLRKFVTFSLSRQYSEHIYSLSLRQRRHDSLYDTRLCAHDNFFLNYENAINNCMQHNSQSSILRLYSLCEGFSVCK
jgi:hypothetical protein